MSINGKKKTGSVVLTVLLAIILSFIGLTASPVLEEAHADTISMNYKPAVYYGGTGWCTNLFVIDGYIPALCADPHLKTPKKGTHSSYVDNSNENVRRALYWSCAGPGGLYGGGAYTGDLVVSHLIVSLAYTGSESAALHRVARGSSLKSQMWDAYNWAVNHPVPSGWTVYAVDSGKRQPILYGVLRQGSLRVNKTAHASYALSVYEGQAVGGARFGVYRDWGCTDLVSTLTTDGGGNATLGNLATGTYYVKEIGVPWPYLTSNDVKPVEVMPDTTSTVSFSDDVTPSVKTHKASAPADGSYETSLQNGSATVTCAASTSRASDGSTAILYKITSSGGTASGVTIALPDEVQYVQSSGSSNVTYDSSSKTIRVSSLASGASATFQGMVDVGWNVDSATATLATMSTSSGSKSAVTAPLNGKSVNGARYAVYKSEADARTDSNRYCEMTIGSDGVASYGLSNGQYLDSYATYYIKEVSSVNDYVLDTTIKSFTTTPGATTDVFVSDKFTPTIAKKKSKYNELTAQDTRFNLIGAEFSFYMSRLDAVQETDAVATMKTDSVVGDCAQAYSTTVPAGTYYVKESKAPHGYWQGSDALGSGDIKQVTITRGALNEFEYDDTIPVNIQPSKTSDNKVALTLKQYPLNGAIFCLYDNEQSAYARYSTVEDAQNAAVATFTTGENGQTSAKTVGLLDAYWIREVKAPGNYQLDSNINNTVKKITYDDFKANTTQSPVFSNTPKPMSLSIKKTAPQVGTSTINANNSKYSLAGAKIRVYKTEQDAINNANYIREVTTRQDGSTTTITDLPPASSYYVKEVSAPSSGAYTVNSTVYQVKYEENNSISQSCTVPESMKPVRITINKKLANGEVTNSLYSFKGTRFGVYSTKAAADKATETDPGDRLSGLIGVYTITSDDQTSVTTDNLPWQQHYYVRELTAASSFKVNNDTFDVDVTDGGGTGTGSTSLTIGNEYLGTGINVEDVPSYCYVKIRKNADGVSMPHNGYSLAGAVFGLYKTKSEADAASSANLGSPLYCITTENSSDGSYSMGISGLLSAGTYYLKEIEAPIGFAPSTQTYQVEAKEGPKPGNTTQTVPYDNDSVKNEREHLATVNAASSAKASINVASADNSISETEDAPQPQSVSDNNESEEEESVTDSAVINVADDEAQYDDATVNNWQDNSSSHIMSSVSSSYDNANTDEASDADVASSAEVLDTANQLVAVFENGKPDSSPYDDKITASSENTYVYNISDVDKNDAASSLKEAGASVVPANIPFSISTDEGGATIDISNDAASDIDGSTAVSSVNQDVPDFSGQNVVAVIDTGAGDNVDGVVGKYSVLGDDGADMNGHGTSMARIIHDQYPNAKVVSIKALNDNGVGTIASVISAMDLAIKMNVKVINLSISAKATDDNSVIEEEINNAYDAGITVVGAAGNDGKNARGFVPGGVNQALIVGACDGNGNKIDSSNFGSTVDFYVKAGSTSEAAARMSAMSAEAFDNGSDIASIDKPDMLFVPDKSKQYEESTGYNGSGDDGQFQTQYQFESWFFSRNVNNDSSCSLYAYWPPTDEAYSRQDHDWLQKNSHGYLIQNGSTIATSTLTWGSWIKTDSSGTTREYNIAYTFYNNGNIDYNNANTYITITQDDNWGVMQHLQGDWENDGAYFNVWVGKIGNGANRRPNITYYDYPGHIQYGKLCVGANDCWTATPYDRPGYTFTGYYDVNNEQVYDANGHAVGRDFTGWDTRTPPWKWYWANLSSFNHTYNVHNSVPVVECYPFNVTVYAHWNPHKYTIRYNANSGTGSMSDMNMTYDETKNLTSNAFSRADYTFKGWNTSPDGSGTFYTDKQSVSNLTTDDGGVVTLYAQWAENTYTVKFDNNGGGQGSTPDMSITTTQRKALSKNGYTRTFKVFKGWNTQRNGTGKWLTDQQTVGINDLKPFDGATKTLFAQWVDANDHSIDWDAIPLAATINDAPITTGIRITKTITSNAQTNGVQQPSLRGAVFGVYNTRDAASAATYQNQGSPVFPVSRTTTDANGQITLTGLTAGNTYYVKELKAPNGYALNNQVYTTTTRLNIMQDVIVPDKPNVLSITLRKTGALTSGSNVPSWYSAKHPLIATYGVYDSKSKADSATPANPGTPVTRITTDARGNGAATIIRADNTTYYLKELVKPEGYELDTSTHAITVNGNKTESESMVLFTANPSVTDSVPCGNISLSKTVTNADSDVDMSSVSYSLYGSEDDARTGKNVITTCRLSATGHGLISNIPYGDYWLKENPDHAPNLETDTEAHKVTVTRNTVNVPTITTHLSDRLDTIGMMIEKRASNMSSSDVDLSGVQFSVYTDKACTTPYKRNGSNLVLTTASDGNTGTVSVPNGTYYVKETSAPSHLKVNDTVYTVTQANNVVYAEDDVVVADCSISLIKKSNNPGYLDNDLSGAVFSVTKDRAGNQRVGTIITDRSGAGSLNNLLPGTYYVREVQALPGHDMDVDSNGNIRVYTVTLGGNSPKSATINGSTGIINNTGSVKLKKSSADASIPGNNNRLFDLSGAVYGVYKDSACSIKATQEQLITDSNGDTNTISGLLSGTYYMKEESTPVSGGYVVSDKPIKFTVNAGANTISNPVVVNDSDAIVKTPPFTIRKASAENGGGSSSVTSLSTSGAEFTVKYYDTLGNISSSDKPVRTWVLRADKYGVVKLDKDHLVSGDTFYTDNSGSVVLIAGTITVEETKAPEGFMLPANNTTRTYRVTSTGIVQINDNGSTSAIASEASFDDDVMRGDLELTKTDVSTGKVMANVPFLITLMSDKDGDGEYETPVESHVVFTDNNGKFSSKSVKHSVNTNKNDEVYTGDAGNVQEYQTSIKDKTPYASSGLWFFNGGAASTVDDSRGALPYGHYRVDEIHSDANSGYSLSYDNEIIIDNDEKNVSIGLDDHRIRIRSTNAIIESNSKKDEDGWVASKVVKDTITYYDAVPGETYNAILYAYNKDTGEQYAVVEGDQDFPYSGGLTFTPTSSTGSVDVEIDLSGAGITSGNIGITAELTRENGETTSEHNTDLSDDDETVHYHRITTIGTDDDTGTHYANYSDNGFTHTFNDKVSYENLEIGEKYTVTSALHVKKYDARTKAYTDAGVLKDKDGNDVTVSRTLSPVSMNGDVTLSLPFSMGDDWHGAEVVAYTRVTKDSTGEVVCSHEDLSSEDQTVRYTYVDTTVLDDVTGRHSGHYSDSDPMSFTDTVRYENLAPNTEYVITMSMVNRKTGEQIKDVNGEPITSTSTIRTDSDNKGTISMKRSFNARSSADVSDAIIYEEITVNGKDAAWHKDLGDLDQNIRYGEVMMPSTGQRGLDYKLLGLIAGITAGTVVGMRRGIERRKRKKNEVVV